VSTHRCCEVAVVGSTHEPITARTTDTDPHPPTFTRRCLDHGAADGPEDDPSAVEVPACLAACVAIGTSVGLSISAATYLRMLLVMSCIASLSYLGASRVRRFVALVVFPSRGALRGTGFVGLRYSLKQGNAPG
jgi:hypothetical protein